MAYQALYRTYRPQNFSEVIGQEVIVRTLQNAIANNKITHAYLFSGPRGTGKTTIARIFAKSLNCDNLNGSEPCCSCTTCKEIAEGISPDVIEIDGASNTGVDDIREIKEKVKFMPSSSKYKIYIIDEVHMLSQSAFNALLKTLEEPPKHVIFILATTEPQKVLPTILSRCQRFDFKSLTVKEISDSVRNVALSENVEITDEAVIGIAESSEGALRDALSYLDQAISVSQDKITIEDVNGVTGNLSYDKTLELAKYLEEKELGLALRTISELVNLGKEVNKIVTTLLQFYRDVLLYKNIDTSMFERYIFQKEEFKNFVEILDAEKVFYYVDVLSDIQTKIRFSTSPNIYLEVAIVKMVNVSSNDLNLLKKVKELEEKIEQIEINPASISTVDAPIMDVERIVVVENKINRVINELSKLELVKVVQKANEVIEGVKNKNPLDSEFENINKKLLSLQEDVELLKVTSNIKSGDSLFTESYLTKDDLKDISEELSAIQKEINTLKMTKGSTNLTTSDTFNDERIDNLEIKVEDLKALMMSKGSTDLTTSDTFNDERIDTIQKEIEELRTLMMSKGSANFDALDDTFVNDKQIDDQRLNNLQREIEELKMTKGSASFDIKEDISNLDLKIQSLENEVELLKRNNTNVMTKGSTSSFSDASGDSNVEERIFQLEEKLNSLHLKVLECQSLAQKKSKSKITDGQMVLFGDDIVRLATLEKGIEKARVDFGDLEKKDYQKEEAYHVNDTPLKEDIYKSLESAKEIEKNIYQEEKKEDYKYEEAKHTGESKQTEQFVEEAKPKSQIVVNKREREEPKVSIGIFSNEKTELLKDLEVTKEVRPVVVEEKKFIEQEELKYEDLDEFERYDIKVVERILNTSQANKKESREKLVSITNDWKSIVFSSPGKQYISEVLQEGEVVVVGGLEIIIVFKNAAICNQVMRRPFRREATNVIRDFLNARYTYLALPIDVWQEKRLEYVTAYQRGELQPRLQPIDTTKLNIGIEKEKVKPEDELVDDVIKMFGNKLVETKKNGE